MFKKRVQMFSKRICELKTRSVYCCGDDQTPPTENEIKILKDTDAWVKVTEVRICTVVEKTN